MQWLDLSVDLQQIRCAPKWSEAKDIALLQDNLLSEIGATAIDEFHDGGNQEDGEAPGAKRPGGFEPGGRP